MDEDTNQEAAQPPQQQPADNRTTEAISKRAADADIPEGNNFYASGRPAGGTAADGSTPASPNSTPATTPATPAGSEGDGS